MICSKEPEVLGSIRWKVDKEKIYIFDGLQPTQNNLLRFPLKKNIRHHKRPSSVPVPREVVQ